MLGWATLEPLITWATLVPLSSFFIPSLWTITCLILTKVHWAVSGEVSPCSAGITRSSYTGLAILCCRGTRKPILVYIGEGQSISCRVPTSLLVIVSMACKLLPSETRLSSLNWTAACLTSSGLRERACSCPALRIANSRRSLKLTTCLLSCRSLHEFLINLSSMPSTNCSTRILFGSEYMFGSRRVNFRNRFSRSTAKSLIIFPALLLSLQELVLKLS